MKLHYTSHRTMRGPVDKNAIQGQEEKWSEFGSGLLTCCLTLINREQDGQVPRVSGSRMEKAMPLILFTISEMLLMLRNSSPHLRSYREKFSNLADLERLEKNLKIKIKTG